MDARTAHILNQMTAQFYAANAEGFSATRQSSWPGWNTVADLLAGGRASEAAGNGSGAAPGGPSCGAPHDAPGADQGTADDATECAASETPWTIADVACGNGRFLKFLCDRFPSRPISYTGWDSGKALLDEARGLAAEEEASARIIECDLIGHLLDEREWKNAANHPTLGTLASGTASTSGTFDLVACFGFFHHVPGEEARLRLLRQLLALGKPGGLVAVSLWRFADHPPLREKAQRSTGEALRWWNRNVSGTPLALDPGDYLLGWGEAAEATDGATAPAFRYCHSFSDDEIDALAAAAEPAARLEARYSADGRTGRLNTYLVFRIQ